MSSPQEIQEQIERTRRSLSADVDRLSEKVSPGKVVGRRVDSVKSTARSVKEKVRGVGDDAAHGMTHVAGSANSAVSSAGSSVADAAGATKDVLGSVAERTGDLVNSAPRQARQQTQGNPLAAGVVAFGVGWLVASLLPPSERERELGRTAEQAAQQLADPLKDAAQEIAGSMQEPLQQAAEQVKTVATEAVHDTVDTAQSRVGDVKAPLQDIPAAAQGSQLA